MLGSQQQRLQQPWEIGTTALYAADGMYSMVTGESFLLNDVFNGNEKAYQSGAVLTTVAVTGFMYLASLGQQGERTVDWLGGVNRSYGYKNGFWGWGIAENIFGPIVILDIKNCGGKNEKKCPHNNYCYASIEWL